MILSNAVPSTIRGFAEALRLISEIMLLAGKYDGFLSPKPQPKLRRQNTIRTVRGSLAIEGNTLSLDQMTAVLEKKRVVGPKREILEVQNAIATYDSALKYRHLRVSDLLASHRSMMNGLIDDAGVFRKKGVRIFQGSTVVHVAPPAKQVPRLVEELFTFVKAERRIQHPPVLSAVVHYALEFIHPFSDGNGRMGRFWQHVMLLDYLPVFGYLPIESVVHAKQKEYYRVLGECDQWGSATRFLEFSLEAVRIALEEFLHQIRPEPATSKTRMEIARAKFGSRDFSRKDYLAIFVALSTATASRDLKEAVDQKTISRTGEKALTRYRFR